MLKESQQPPQCFQPWVVPPPALHPHPYPNPIFQRLSTVPLFGGGSHLKRSKMSFMSHLPKLEVNARMQKNLVQDYAAAAAAAVTANAAAAGAVSVAAVAPDSNKARMSFPSQMCEADAGSNSQQKAHDENAITAAAAANVSGGVAAENASSDPTAQLRPKSSSSYDSGCPDVVGGVTNGSDGCTVRGAKRKASVDADQPEDLTVSSYKGRRLATVSPPSEEQKLEVSFL